MADTPGVTTIPVHDHRFGACTLPGEISARTMGNAGPQGQCFWAAAGYHVLGCKGEGGSCSRERQIYRRQANRRDRYRVRRALRAYRGEV
jgi:hypothetical protein